MHHRFAAALADAWASIRTIQASARRGEWDGSRPRWPLIVLRTPKGWTGPQSVDGVQVTGTWRSHQVPVSGVKGNEEHLCRRLPDRRIGSQVSRSSVSPVASRAVARPPLRPQGRTSAGCQGAGRPVRDRA